MAEKKCETYFYPLSVLTANAQEITFKITGTIQNPGKAKYAYLTTLSQQIPISSDKVFIKAPIVNGKFEFNGSFDLLGKNLQQASVFVDERDNITKGEVALKFKNLIWVSGRDPHLLRVYLENLDFVSPAADNMLPPKIISGRLTQDFYTFLEGIKDRANIAAFIRKNPVSPVSLLALEHISFLREDDIKPRDSVAQLFYSLSPELKNSNEGKALKRELHIN